MDPKEEESRARYRYLQLKKKAAGSAPDMGDAPASPEGRDYSLFRSEFQAPQIPSGTGFDTMLTNKPVGVGGSIVRSGFSAAGALAGGAAGAAGGPLGIVGGAALGGFTPEILRQNAVQMTQMANGQDVTTAGEAIGRATSEGIAQGAGAGLGIGVGGYVKPTGEAVNGLAQWARPGINRAGAGLLKIAAGVPENVGMQVMENPSVLLGAPGRDAVNALYDAYHKASGTMSRDEFISRSAKPSDVGRVGSAIDEMDAFRLAMRNGTATEQQAVNASQAGRIVADARREGAEISHKMSEFAAETKAMADQFIAQGRGPQMRVKSIPVAQEINREATPIASKLNKKSEVFQSATSLVPEQVSVPLNNKADILPEIRNVVEMVKRAKGSGVAPNSIMTESERNLYRQFRQPIESAAEHNVPVESLLTSAERAVPLGGTAEQTVMRQGDPIYSGANRYEFGGTVDKVRYKPGAEIMGDFPVQSPALPGYAEYGTARDAARREFLHEEMGVPLAKNKGGNSVSVLRPWHAATVGAGLGAGLGGPLGAAIGGAAGLMSTSPLLYRTALQGAAVVGKVPGVVYRVGVQSGAGAAGSSIAELVRISQSPQQPSPAFRAALDAANARGAR